MNTAEIRRDLTMTRTFDAPRALVYKMWTDVDHVAAWWGPAQFTNPVCRLDPRPGGHIEIHMQAPDGTIHPMIGTYRELEAPERIVFTSSALDASGQPLFEILNTITLEDEDGKTRLTLHAEILQATEQAVPMLSGMQPGWQQSLLRFDMHIFADREITCTRVLAAPRTLVFEMFTKPEHVARWWGPDGFTLTIHEMDVRPGGSWRFIMHGPDGKNYDNHNVYEVVDAPERLVYDHVSAPRHHVTITFDEWMGRTWITMRSRLESAEFRNQVDRAHGAVKGMQQTLDRLVELLSSPR